jgi:hypothetical protein
MNKTQKGAWYGVYLSVFLLIAPVGDLIGIDLTKMHPVSHFFVVSIPAVLLILPLFFIDRKRKGAEAEIDERDNFIIKRALLTAFVSVFGLLGVAYLVVLFILSPKVSITLSLLPAVVYGAFIIFIIILSVAVLVQYGWRNKNGEG